MSTVTTTRPIDPVQLTAELGVASITVAIGDTETTVTADVDEATLQAAVDAHTPAPPPPSAEQAIADLQTANTNLNTTVDELIIFVLTNTPSGV